MGRGVRVNEWSGVDVDKVRVSLKVCAYWLVYRLATLLPGIWISPLVSPVPAY